MLNLTKQQKNEIFKTIERKGLNPNLFSWEVHQSKFVRIFRRSAYEAASGYEPDSAVALVLRNDEQFFSFTFELDETGVYYSQTVPQISAGPGIRTGNWAGLIDALEDWLGVIKYELEEPDLWKELPRGQALTAIPSDYSQNDKFSAEERHLLAEQLSKIQKFIVESNRLEGPTRIQVQQTFIYLQQRTETTSKLDWKNIFVGAIVSLMLEKTVSNAPEIMKLCDELLSPLFLEIQKLIR